MTLVLRSTRRAGEVLLLVLTSAILGAEIIRQPSMIRLAAAGCLGICAIVAATQWPRAAAVTTVALLPYLAFGRRLLLEFTPWKSTDPLLLVAPAVAFVILVRVVAIERRPLGSDRISRLMVFLVVLSFIEAFNPRGGGLSAGLAALLFTVVPLIWFFVGREVGTRGAVEILLGCLVVSACLVATYGLIQIWDGFPAWDRLWLSQSSYTALDVKGVTRAFATFSSAAEYGSFLAIGIVVAFAFAVDRRPYLLPAVPLLAIALFYESSRGIIVTTVVAVLVVLAARTGSLRRATLALIILLAAVLLGVTLARGSIQNASTSSNGLVAHQTSGLLHPLDQNKSTLPVHLALLENGFKRGIFDPIGYGIASTTLAGSRLGAPESASTEVDLSNVFVADGTLGGLAYAAVLVLVLMAALRHAVATRDAASLAVLGILVANFGQWLNGGFYAVSALIWFSIGFLVAAERRRVGEIRALR